MTQNWKDEVRGALSARTVGLLAGVLLVQLAFIGSYVGAFHDPSPHRMDLAVVAPVQQSASIVDKLAHLDGDPLEPRAVSDEAAARRLVRTGGVDGAFVIDPTATTDQVLVASGGGTSLATAVEQVLTEVDASQKRTVTVEDVVPPKTGDARGLSGFYLVIGWMVGGYLVASLLGVAFGSRPTNRRRALIRVGATVPYAIVSGLGGALVVDQIFGALTGHFLALWGLGTLLVLSAATVTIALQTLLGTIGIGVTILLFVVLGNPSAGGAYQTPLLPGPWRELGPLLPNGAGTEAVRRIIYFGSGVGSQLLVIALFAVVGAVVSVLGTQRSPSPADSASDLA